MAPNSGGQLGGLPAHPACPGGERPGAGEAEEGPLWGGPQTARTAGPSAARRALLAIVAKADDVRVCAVAAGDGLVLEDACNTRQAAAGSPRPPGPHAATATIPHGLDRGALTTVTLTIDAACAGTRARTAPP